MTNGYPNTRLYSKCMFTCGVQRAYEQWACSQKLAVFGAAGAEATAPCLDVCQQVEERCPHLVPDPDDGSGEPAFLCGASHPFGVQCASAFAMPCTSTCLIRYPNCLRHRHLTLSGDRCPSVSIEQLASAATSSSTRKSRTATWAATCMRSLSASASSRRRCPRAGTRATARALAIRSPQSTCTRCSSSTSRSSANNRHYHLPAPISTRCSKHRLFSLFTSNAIELILKVLKFFNINSIGFLDHGQSY